MTLEEIKRFAKENGVKISVTLFDDETYRKENANWGTLWLNEIIVKPKFRQKGIGTKVIRLLQDFAKAKNLNIRLLACNCYGTNLENLYRFYYNLGFRYDKSEKRDESSFYMIWED